MPLPFDIHSHTRLCKHAALVSTNEYIDKAASIGLMGFSVCCHNPFKGDGYDIYRMDMCEFDTFLDYHKDGKAYAAEKYSTLEIAQTLEVDYDPTFWPETRAFLEEKCKDFDAFLGSVHFNPAKDREYFEGLSPEERLRVYFERFEAAVKTKAFDTMSHIAYYRRRGPVPAPEIECEYLRHAVRLVADNDVCLELNTSGGKASFPVDYYLPREVIKLCAEYKIPITFGSDAHDPKNVGKNFEEGIALLKEYGITQACFFRKHKRVFYDL